MKFFYGVYLQNSELSTTLDLIRFLSEPDSIRFSHITLRGPYLQRINSHWLSEQNSNYEFDWKIDLLRPGNFFDRSQSTVFLEVGLRTLSPLIHKRDFPKALPHLTLYDGSDREFGKLLFDLLSSYQWSMRVPVTRLRVIGKKERVDEVFLSFFVSFHEAFKKYVGDPLEIPLMSGVNKTRRLGFIERLLAHKFRRHGPLIRTG